MSDITKRVNDKELKPSEAIFELAEFCTTDVEALASRTITQTTRSAIQYRLYKAMFEFQSLSKIIKEKGL